MSDLAHFGYKESFAPFGDPDAQDPDPEVRKRFFGKYRGSVVTNVDPLRQGRLIVRVPDVFGLLTSNWALPCVPLAGPKMGASFVPPPVGASVWVEFEQGDPETPIWVGCFWETPETLGTMALVAGLAPTPSVTLETFTSGIGVSETPTLPPTEGNVRLYAGGGVTSISLNPAGVTITAPTVKTVAKAEATITAPDINITAETDATITAPDINITAETDATIIAPAVNILAADVNIVADGVLTITAPAVIINGAVNVDGVLTVNTAPVVVVPV